MSRVAEWLAERAGEREGENERGAPKGLGCVARITCFLKEMGPMNGLRQVLPVRALPPSPNPGVVPQL